MSENSAARIKSVQTALAVIETLYERDGARVDEVADAVDVSKSSAHRHLTTLERENYVVREGDEYVLSLQFLELGDYVGGRKGIFRLAEPKVREIADETGERAQFVVEEHGYVRYVHRATGDRAVKTTSGVGKRVRMHAVAAGKAILAELPEERVRNIIAERGLPAFTEHTITDEARLFEELGDIRERGVAFADEELVEGLRAVGVLIRGSDDRVLGALTVAGPTHRLKDDVWREDIPNLLLGTANEPS
ncbi:IclR family transcriptional regulator [Halomicroarcula sp. GCM10025324]|uniref:IclR family transcriptional regulator n=1 Tax=Haloarcula TaxID=2237 RepID=UPI0023E8C123|nr:IclR family transcriptional regulator [Halomicroarcula sp. ZS-22-S1]